MNRENIIKEALVSARNIQEFLWGNNDGNYDLSSWLSMMQKRLDKICYIDFENPHSEIELRKRVLQNAALSIALLEVIDEKGSELLLNQGKIDGPNDTIKALKEELKYERDCLDDFVLEQDHLPECSYPRDKNISECRCMDRSHYSYELCLERAQERIKKRKEHV